MATVKAIVNVSPGRAEILDVPYPKLPKDDYLIVKPTAWAVNPTDPYHVYIDGEEACSGCHVGCDYAGVVVEVGPGVTKGFKKGDRIAGAVNGQNIVQKTDGAFAEIITAKGDVQMKIPDNVSDVDAATQGIAVGTLAQSLYRDLKLPLPSRPSGDPFTIFIYGGSTAMGIAGIQFAKLSGGTVIATASPSNFDYLKSLGADHVVDYNSPNLVQNVLEVADGPIKHALDCRPSDSSATVCAKVLSRDGDARYSALLTETEDLVKQVNPHVETFITLAYSVFGEPWFYEKQYRDPSAEDYELAKSFAVVAEELLAQGKLKAPRVYLNRGGKGFEGLLHGIEEVRMNNVRGGKLVYTLE